MSETNIFRPLTKEEKVDVVELGTESILEKFLDAVARKRAECQKNYRPFDGYSARFDFEEQVRKAVIDGGSNLQKTKINIDLPDLDVYTNADRFVLIDIKPVVENKLLDGMKQAVVTGKEFNFRTKPRGNGISIFVPNSDVAEVEARYVVKEVKENKKEPAK